MIDYEQWQELVNDWRNACDVYLQFPLFENGWMVNERLEEHTRLGDVERDARKRMDDFVKARFGEK